MQLWSDRFDEAVKRAERLNGQTDGWRSPKAQRRGQVRFQIPAVVRVARSRMLRSQKSRFPKHPLNEALFPFECAAICTRRA
jgi:hypothetical protein